MVIVVMLGSLKYRDLYIQQEISGLQRLLRVLSREMIERINAGTGTVGSLCKEYSL